MPALGRRSGTGMAFALFLSPDSAEASMRQIGSRIKLAVLLGLTLTGALPVLGQCPKRIVVYLDTSGSMDLRGRSPNSPFRQSLEAIESLFRSKGFIESDDVVELVPFGERVESHSTAQGTDEVLKKLDRLKRSVREANDTNLGSVLEDADRLLEGTSPFARQVVIVASDFAHEPRSLSHGGSALQSWSTTFSQWQPKLSGQLGKGTKVPLLLFRAPATGRTITGEAREDIQNKVIADFEQSLIGPQDVLPVGQGGRDPADLAQAIQMNLLAPPEVTARLAKSEQSQIELRVSNPNCFPLTLKTMNLRCQFQEGGALSDPVPVVLKPEQRKLGPTGSDQASQVITKSRPKGDCWDRSSDFVATAETEEGVNSKQVAGTTATTLDLTPKQAYIEGWLWRHVLRLEVELRGQYAGPRRFVIALRETRRDAEIARGEFEAPTDLDPDQPKLYRLVFSVRDTVADRLSDGDKLLVRLPEGKVSEEALEVRKDDYRSLQNLITSLVSLLSFFVGLFTALKKNSSLKSSTPGGRDRWAFTELVLKGILSQLAFLVPFILGLLRANLLQQYSLRAVDLLTLSTAVLVVGVACFNLIRGFQEAQIAEEVFTSKPPVDVDRYLKRTRSGWIAPATALCAMTLTILVAFFAFFSSRSEKNLGSPRTISLIQEQE
jgi:hypothetical protein